jgi:nucleoredoxin
MKTISQIICLALISSLAVSHVTAGLNDLIPAKLHNAKGEEVSRDKLQGKIVGIYFSAKWCPPCRGFTPSLVKFRDANQKDFEVVFVSSDRNAKAQKDYMNEYKMQWVTMEHNSAAANKLKKNFKVSGIPTLVIVGPDGKTITTDGRGAVSRNPKGAVASWKKKTGKSKG